MPPVLPSAAALLDRHFEQPVLHDLICLECGRLRAFWSVVLSRYAEGNDWNSLLPLVPALLKRHLSRPRIESEGHRHLRFDLIRIPALERP